MKPPEDTAAPVETPATPVAADIAPVAVSDAPAKARKAKAKVKTKKKAAKKPTPARSDSEFLELILEQLYKLRANPKVWADLRMKSKEAEALETLLKKEPRYAWRLVGISHYLEARHSENTVVAYILPHNPRKAYEAAMKDYHAALKRATKRSKPPELPVKPTDMKPCYSWTIAGRKNDSASGTCAKFDEAVMTVLSQSSLFIV